jgi:hypothetical protein
MFLKHVQMIQITSLKIITNFFKYINVPKNLQKKLSNFDDLKNKMLQQNIHTHTHMYFTFWKKFPKKTPYVIQK